MASSPSSSSSTASASRPPRASRSGCTPRSASDLGIPAVQGRRYSWGYPAVPDQSEHEKVDALLDLSQIGMELSDGYAPVPEQSTLALVAHHPQAFYFGMKQGKLKPLDAVSPDDIIKGSKRDPSLFAEADAQELDSDPLDGGVAEEDKRVAAQL